MSPLAGQEVCYNHDPGRQAERKESRRLGGLHRRRRAARPLSETPITLGSVGAILRYLEGAAEDLRSCDPGVARARTQIYLAGTAMKVVELADIEGRIAALEAQSGAAAPWEGTQ